MVSEKECQQLKDAKYWQEEEQKEERNLPFLTSQDTKEDSNSNFIVFVEHNYPLGWVIVFFFVFTLVVEEVEMLLRKLFSYGQVEKISRRHRYIRA